MAIVKIFDSRMKPKVFKLLSACLCLCLLFGCNVNPHEINLHSGKVIRVISGQTVEMTWAGTSEVIQVRITGIDAPDLRQSPWGTTAKQRLTELVMGFPIEIETEDLNSDRFNRINAHLWQDKNLISQKLVEEGCVLANESYSHSYSKLLMDAQEYARLMGYGIWNPKLALRTTPNQFRSMIK
jgi:micrococcal nuclease